MPTPTDISELSTTAASNYPAGSEAPSVLDDVQRAHASFIALLRDTAITIDGVQTLTNKTLTAPVIATIVNGAATLTLPAATDTLLGRTNPAFVGAPVEDVYTITDGASVDLSPSNGSIQIWALGANRTPILPTNWTAGQSIVLMIDDGASYAVTWTTVGVTWLPVGSVAPTLSTTGYTKAVLWKVGTTIYGAY